MNIKLDFAAHSRAQNITQNITQNIAQNITQGVAKAIGGVFIALLCARPGLAVQVEDYPALQPIVDALIQTDGYPQAELLAVLAEARLDESILRAMQRQYEALPWYKYQALFINAKNIRNGTEFWRQHQRVLQQAEQVYGVPQSIIVAVLGVETRYGTNLGNKRVLDALVTLTADYPRRSEFFGKQLRIFLNTTRQENIPATSVFGSYAGAFGIPQFMPSSYADYAVDFNHNGSRDLVNEVEDAIGSVANYLKAHGWQPQQKIFAPVQGLLSQQAEQLVTRRAKPELSLLQLEQAGVVFKRDQASARAALLRLELENGNDYVVGFNNLYALTRYNPSVNYAMVVTKLAERIGQRYATP